MNRLPALLFVFFIAIAFSFALTEPTKPLAANSCGVFKEGDLIKIKYDAVDPDNNVGPAGKLLYTFTKPFNASGEWQTKRGDAGSYNAKVVVSDGEYNDTADVCLNIESSNHKPLLIVKDMTAIAGDSIKLMPVCTDADGDQVTLSYKGKMTSDAWQTTGKDIGKFPVTVTCTDSYGAKDEKTISITLQPKPPVIALIADITVQETGTVKLSPACNDPAGSKVNLSYTGKMTRDTWTTTYGDAGAYNVTVTCKSVNGVASQDVKITVTHKNRAPHFVSVTATT